MLKENTAVDCGVDGFNLTYCSDLTLVENTADGAGRDGIRLNGVTDSILRENLAKEADNNGFSVDRALEVLEWISVGNMFEENASEYNAWYGYFFVNEASAEREFVENTCKGNGYGGCNLPGICN